jgi:hypothetical protein
MNTHGSMDDCVLFVKQKSSSLGSASMSRRCVVNLAGTGERTERGASDLDKKRLGKGIPIQEK